MKIVKQSVLCLTLMGLMALPGYAQSGMQSGSGQSGRPSSSQPGMSSPSQAGAGDQSSMGQAGVAASDQTQANANSSSGMSDQDFIKKAAQVDLAEVQMAQLAQQKSQSEHVKQMAQQILNDHQQNEEQVKQLAQKNNVTLPDQPDSKHQAELQKLQKLDGAAFDKAFIKAQRKDHQKTVNLFREQAKNAKNPDVKSYAEQTLPKLEQHLDMARGAMKEGGNEQAQTTASTKSPK